MSTRLSLSLGLVTMALFACDGERDMACEDKGCGSYHGPKYEDSGSETVTGSISLSKPATRSFDPSPDPKAPITIAVHDNGTLDIYENKKLRAHLAIHVPEDEDEEDLDDDDIRAELWHCASKDAELSPIAEDDGDIRPGCFEAGKDVVPAIVDPLEGTLTVMAPPVSLEDLRQEESGFAFHYRIATKKEGDKPQIDLDVSAWHKHKLASCGEFY